MIEIEAKVKLVKDDLPRLKEQLEDDFKFIKHVKKIDFYYDVGKKISVRIRHIGNQKILTIKEKERGEGIEKNIELEWGIKSLDKLITSAGIKPKWYKEKSSEIYSGRGVSIELNEIKHLGFYLEIEATSKAKLIETFKELGFNQKQFEKKYYLELLKNKAIYA